MAAPTYDGVERAGVWFVLTRAELDYDTRRDGLDELVLVVDGVVMQRLMGPDFTHVGIRLL